ncbi:MAG: tRNA (adenosine(37)-N6)-threonylcarbamoyltransferase complex dimerization subunit type 1 TsaB [Proteobacteria bacterium]|nr:tRNA (adenosine(37)-N6)-threonylcarbamoyltransferase complex dimerization subunit type 1 TsaB [Pseudomonadota bacterium]HQR02541.1 tRNA (adenosine(37)-N6)-threonylcarbamoyltransferase complex dimerization subunit type 1 TsaB [Rhodocyclaceae bacterium]
MNLLALETSTRLLSVALWRDGALLERHQDQINGGSDRILPWVRELLAEAELTLPRLDGIAFGAGPGSFTGLRLACGITQGLAFGADLPVLPVGSLEALALASGRRRVYACLDARMGEVYSACYALEASRLVEVQAPTVTTPDAAPVPAGEGWTGCGDGFAVYGPVLSARLGTCLVSTEPLWLPTAASVATLAAPRLAAGEGLPASQAAPLYIRDKVALTTAERLARGGRA